jgi:hypothetical protein
MFDPVRVERERRWQVAIPTVTPRRLVMDGALTAVVECQLWHHLYVSRSLCELSPERAREPSESSFTAARQSVVAEGAA